MKTGMHYTIIAISFCDNNNNTRFNLMSGIDLREIDFRFFTAVQTRSGICSLVTLMLEDCSINNDTFLIA